MSIDQKVAAQFIRETAGHELTILHDDGLYRHVRMANPQYGGLYHFALITWPHHLAIAGDLGHFTFRTEMADMFDFFRRSRWNDGPNPTYWDEKVTAGRESVMAFSEEKFKAEWADELAEAEATYPGLGADWLERTEGFLADYDLTEESNARHAVHDYEYSVDGVDEPFTFNTSDLLEVNFREHSWPYLRACRAIVHGIAAYDRELRSRELRASRRRIRDARRGAFALAGAR